MIEPSPSIEYIEQSFVNGEVRWQQMKQCLKFGIKKLDKLVKMYPGSITLFHGELSNREVRRLITRLVVSIIVKNKMNLRMAFVDGANVFPFFEIGEKARKKRLDPLFVLDRIHLARAFNYHQVTEIITKQLPKLVEEKQINVVMIPQVSSQFLSDEAKQYLQYDRRHVTSSLTELTQALGVLKSLALRYNLVSIMTASTAPNSKVKALGGTYLAHICSSIVQVKSQGLNNFTFNLIKDPERAVSAVHFFEKTNHIPLSEFLTTQ
ncbi:MAG: hypothetical protein ACTSW1_06365 [Candidatus Hodarchaeales archaeon]